jgi:hypothetical protein
MVLVEIIYQVQQEVLVVDLVDQVVVEIMELHVLQTLDRVEQVT